MVGSCFCHNPCRNLPKTSKDEPAGGVQRPSPVNSSGSPLLAPSPTNSCVPTPAASHTPTPALVSAPAPALVSAPAKYTNAEFYRFMKVFMDAQRYSGTYEGPEESSLKARFPDLYHRKSHMNCYQFC